MLLLIIRQSNMIEDNCRGCYNFQQGYIIICREPSLHGLKLSSLLHIGSPKLKVKDNMTTPAPTSTFSLPNRVDVLIPSEYQVKMTLHRYPRPTGHIFTLTVLCSHSSSRGGCSLGLTYIEQSTF